MLNKEKLEAIKKAINITIIPSSKHYVSYYDEVTGMIQGRRAKQFVRSDSRIFEPLFEELQNNPDSSYVTYANTVIKEGFIPKHLSTLIKYQGESRLYVDAVGPADFAVKEVLAGQLLNYYGVNTCYNVITKDNILDDYQVVSVDFVPYGSEFITFDELNYILGFDLDRDILYQLPELYKCEELKGVDKQEIDKLCEQYFYSYMVRKFVLRDADFAHTNSGFLKGEDGKLDFINFDYEFCFDSLYILEYYDSRAMKRELLMIEKEYPEIVKKFVEKTKELYEGILALNGQMDCSLEEYRTIVDYLTEYLKQVLDVVKIIEEEKTM